MDNKIKFCNLTWTRDVLCKSSCGLWSPDGCEYQYELKEWPVEKVLGLSEALNDPETIWKVIGKGTEN